jgi:lipopolysaccharide export system protein LptA
MRNLATLIALVAIAVPLGSAAQTKHNSDAPVDFSADSGELQDKAGKGILTGNVVVRQGEMTLTAARVIVTYSGQVINGAPAASRFDASGGVTVTRPDQIAKGQYGIYDVSRRVIIMLGAVTLAQGANVVKGNRLTMNLDTGKAVIDGSGVASSAAPGGIKTAPGGRVSGRFSVPKRTQ